MQRFKFVALGQGQGPVAEQYLEQGAAKGYWVLLQNFTNPPCTDSTPPLVDRQVRRHPAQSESA